VDADTVRLEAETPVVGLRADFDEIVQTLSDAFAVDPHFDWFMREGAGRDAARRAFFQLLIGHEAHKGRVDRPAGGGAGRARVPGLRTGRRIRRGRLRAQRTRCPRRPRRKRRITRQTA